jgi:hypothetical protein
MRICKYLYRKRPGINVLVAIVRKRLKLEVSLYQILQILSLTQFEKIPILQALQERDCDNDLGDICNQLNLFDWPPVKWCVTPPSAVVVGPAALINPHPIGVPSQVA